MKKILILLFVLSSTSFAAGQEGCCSITNNVTSPTINAGESGCCSVTNNTSEDDISVSPSIVIIVGNTMLQCHRDGGCAVVQQPDS